MGVIPQSVAEGSFRKGLLDKVPEKIWAPIVFTPSTQSTPGDHNGEYTFCDRCHGEAGNDGLRQEWSPKPFPE